MITAETLLQQQPVHGISGGCASILRVLLYYDLFDYPLTAHEISLFLDRADIGIDTVNKKLSSLALKGLIDSEKGYWFLGDHSASDCSQTAPYGGRRKTNVEDCPAFLLD